MTGLESKSVQRTAFSELRPITVREALQEGAELLSRAGVESARLDAELLLGKAFGWTREEIYLNYEMKLGREVEELFHTLLRRRAQREPVAYIIGEREFWSLAFRVTPDVLVPRPETEILVEVTVGLVEAEFQIADRKLQILDLGTGSGTIAVSLAREIADVEIWATDVSLEALEVAWANACHHGAQDKIHFLAGDLFEPVGARRGSFQMIVSNPPYVRRREWQELAREVCHWEPKLALDGGPDGLAFYRRIIEDAHLYLADGGFVGLEIGADMGAEVCRLFANAGCYAVPSVYQDYAGKDRVVVARKLPSRQSGHYG